MTGWWPRGGVGKADGPQPCSRPTPHPLPTPETTRIHPQITKYTKQTHTIYHKTLLTLQTVLLTSSNLKIIAVRKQKTSEKRGSDTVTRPKVLNGILSKVPSILSASFSLSCVLVAMMFLPVDPRLHSLISDRFRCNSAYFPPESATGGHCRPRFGPARRRK